MARFVGVSAWLPHPLAHTRAHGQRRVKWLAVALVSSASGSLRTLASRYPRDTPLPHGWIRIAVRYGSFRFGTIRIMLGVRFAFEFLKYQFFFFYD